MKERQGGVIWDDRRSAWVARINFTDGSGKRRERRRQVENKSEGRRLLQAWARQLESSGGDKFMEGGSLNFRKLAGVYQDRELQPAVFKGSVLVSGKRSWKTQRGFLKNLVAYFGNRKVAHITHSDLVQYKRERITTKTFRGDDRSLAHVNRELSLLRTVLNFALRNGWLSVNPFKQGPPVIKMADEPPRQRILSRSEEALLLAACTGRRRHLRQVIIFLLDTGCRRGEMFTIEWRDVDLVSRMISVRAETTKALRPRTIGITSRLKAVFEAIGRLPHKDTDKVFRNHGDPKRAFASACEAAGISDIRVHDLRHTCISRWVNEGKMTIAEAMRLAGHSTLAVSYRYLNINTETARRAADAMDRIETEQDAAELVN